MSRTSEISIAVVLEKPWFDAWPPAIMAKGDLVEPITRIWIEFLRANSDKATEHESYHRRSVLGRADLDNTDRNL